MPCYPIKFIINQLLMSKLYSKFFFTVLFIVSGLLLHAQVSVVATAGTVGPTSYTTLKAAFDAINAGTHKGTVTVTISGNTTETASAVINANAAPASYTAINVNTT